MGVGGMKIKINLVTKYFFAIPIVRIYFSFKKFNFEKEHRYGCV